MHRFGLSTYRFQDVAEALRRLPPEVIQARNARLRRAIDLDMKHDHLHGELLAKQTPSESYLQVRGRQGFSSSGARGHSRMAQLLGASAHGMRLTTRLQ